MDDQIQLNILADGIVSDTLSTAIRYLIYRAKIEPATFGKALDHIKMDEESGNDLSFSSEGELSPYYYPTRKSVTFTASSPLDPTAPAIHGPSTPLPTSTVSFSYDDDLDEEVTRL